MSDPGREGPPHGSVAFPLACTVRGCGEALVLDGRTRRCPRGHAFDLARVGYVNLLQPTDKRAAQPGDDAEAVAARVRLRDAGVDAEHIVRATQWLLAQPFKNESPRAVDVGAGIGTWLGAWTAARPLEAAGVDLSTRCAGAAARAVPHVTWAVANADHGLPFPTGSIDVVLSVKGPKNPAEFARILAPEGALLLVVSAPDDLLELRSATAGGGFPRDPADAALERLGADFELVERFDSRSRAAYSAPLLRDLLRVSYRGIRRSEAERLEALDGLEVTTSATFLHLVPRGGAPRGESASEPG